MSPKRSITEKERRDRDEGESAAKNRRLMRLPSKKLKCCYIHTLPNEVLQKIVGYISYWHRPRLRQTCRRMRNICDSVLLHEFHKWTFFYNCFEPDGYELAALTAIKDATWPYVLYGFDSVFCGSILPLIWNRAAFTPEPRKIKTFLKHFFSLVDARIGDTHSQLARLLYSISLMRLLRKFRSSRVLASVHIVPNYWRMVLELRGPWIGVLWSSKSAAESQELGKLLMILCEIIIADSTHRAFKKVWECDNEIFVYGNDTSERWDRINNAKTVFTFKISAPHRIMSLLQAALEQDHVQWPTRLPRNEFEMFIDVACKEALKWGCCEVHHIGIVPHFELDYDRENGEPVEVLSSLDLIRTASVMSSSTIVEMD